MKEFSQELINTAEKFGMNAAGFDDYMRKLSESLKFDEKADQEFFDQMQKSIFDD